MQWQDRESNSLNFAGCYGRRKKRIQRELRLDGCVAKAPFLISMHQHDRCPKNNKRFGKTNVDSRN
jgi:hypothetical protein